ncbi:hypothetical protein Q3C01_43580 [Bradyrhizobium sp. UFLA05-109]
MRDRIEGTMRPKELRNTGQADLLRSPFGPSAIVSGSAYLFLQLSAVECLTSFADSPT